MNIKILENSIYNNKNVIFLLKTLKTLNTLKTLKTTTNILYIFTLLGVFSIYKKIKYKNNKFLYILNLIPYIKKIINDKFYSTTLTLENKSNYNHYKQLPHEETKYSVINNKFNDISIKQNSKISGIIYSDTIYNESIQKIYNKYIKTNPLHPDIFPEIKLMEIDIINICRCLYKGDNKCCGNITSGGTESILLACVTYRDYCKSIKNIIKPNIIGFNTIHPAFDKACHYFNIKLIKVDTIQNMKKTINSNTICIVGSAPDYSYGLIDPILEMSNLALKYNTNFHLDACMGGLLIPFITKFNYINFNIIGITSISMDTHKYGFSPKGTSVLLFRNYKIKKYQHFINKDWCGGIYASPTMLGSKSGGIIASTWASLLLRGKNNYIRSSKNINDNLYYIKDQYKNSKINEYLEIIGNPQLNIIAFKSEILNIYSVINKMSKMDWHLSIMQNPPAFHFCITEVHSSEICKTFIEDLEKCVLEVYNDEIIDKNKTPLDSTLSIYGSDNIKKGIFVEEIIHNYIFLLSQENISFIYK